MLFQTNHTAHLPPFLKALHSVLCLRNTIFKKSSCSDLKYTHQHQCKFDKNEGRHDAHYESYSPSQSVMEYLGSLKLRKFKCCTLNNWKCIKCATNME